MSNNPRKKFSFWAENHRDLFSGSYTIFILCIFLGVFVNLLAPTKRINVLLFLLAFCFVNLIYYIINYFLLTKKYGYNGNIKLFILGIALSIISITNTIFWLIR